MKRSIVLAWGLILATAPLAVLARDAQRIDFAYQGANGADLNNPVGESLINAFNHAVDNVGERAASLPDRQAFLPQTSWRLPSAAERNQPIRQSHCEAGEYEPTWWNPPAAERRRAEYFFLIGEIACEFRLPRRLLDALIAQESGFNPYAVSKAGAAGMMQIMPGTARSLGLMQPFNPAANLRAGASYFRKQLDRFGRFDLALAAYNAGPERRALQYGTIPAISETRSYVQTILTNWSRLIELETRATARQAERAEFAARTATITDYSARSFQQEQALGPKPF